MRADKYVKDVTVLVLGYNSAKTILETLESIKNQTFKNIHIVVSDDCSSDITFTLATQWIEKNKRRFLSSLCNKTSHNLGVSMHMNSCMSLLPTEWFKDLAADDILLPDCLEKYVDFINSNNCHGIVYAKHLNFIDNTTNSILKRTYHIDAEEIEYQKYFSTLSVSEQRLMIAKREVLCSPTCFTNRDDVISAGGYDNRIKNIEDWPIKMRLLDQGYKMNRMDEYTVLYRLGNSVSRSNALYFKPEHIAMEQLVKNIYCYPLLRKSMLYRWNNAITKLRYHVIVKLLGNKRNKINKFINYLFCCFDTNKLKKAIINMIYQHKARQKVEFIVKKYGL